MKQLQRGLAPARRQSTLAAEPQPGVQPAPRSAGSPAPQGSRPRPPAPSASATASTAGPFPLLLGGRARPKVGRCERATRAAPARSCRRVTAQPSILRTQVYARRPYTARPASTPDLSRPPPVSSNSPTCVTRRVCAVQAFQEDSSPVARHSLQEVSEPLAAARAARPAAAEERPAASSWPAWCTAAGPAAARESRAGSRRGASATPERTAQSRGQLGGGHGKSLSDATVLIHSSVGAGRGPRGGPRRRQPRAAAPDAHAPLAPGPLHILEPQAQGTAPGEITRRREGRALVAICASGGADLTRVGRYRARKGLPHQKRPASDLLSAKNAVEGLPRWGWPCVVQGGRGGLTPGVVPPADLPFSASSALCHLVFDFHEF